MINLRNIMLFFTPIVISYFSFAEDIKTQNIESKKLSFSGFLDLRYQEGDLSPLENGFKFYDGAIIIQNDWDSASSLYIDIPIHWQGAQDTNEDGINDNFSNEWVFGENKSQAFISYENEHYLISFGQFDTPLGLEKNDSRDLDFAKQGQLYEEFSPKNHLGIKLDYHLINSVDVQFLISNYNQQGSQAGRLPEYAFLFKKRFSNFYVYPAIYTHRWDEKDFVLYQIRMGTQTSKINLSLEANRVVDNINREDKIGYNLILDYIRNEKWSSALRTEFWALLDEKSHEDIDQTIQFTLSVKFKVNADLRVLMDITHLDKRPLFGLPYNRQEFTLAVQHSF